MTNIIPASNNIIENNLILVFLIFVRISTILFMLPGFGESYVPVRQRLTISVVISLLILPITVSNTHLNLQGEYLAMIFGEIIIGIFLSISFRFSIFSLQVAGAIIAQLISIAQVFGGIVSSDAQSTVSNILNIASITLLMTTGFPEGFVAFTSYSYEELSLGSKISSNAMLRSTLSITTISFDLALQLSLPFVALSLFYNITLGAINRAMPQLLVSFVGAPAIIAMSIAFLVISIEPMISTWHKGFRDMTSIIGG